MAQEKTFQEYASDLETLRIDVEKADKEALEKSEQWSARIEAVFREDMKSNDAALKAAVEKEQTLPFPRLRAFFGMASSTPPPRSPEEALMIAHRAAARIPSNEEYEKAIGDAHEIIRELTGRLMDSTIHLFEVQSIRNAVEGREFHQDAALSEIAQVLARMTDEAIDTRLYPAWQRSMEARNAALEPLSNAAFRQYVKENPRAAQILRAIADSESGGTTTAGISAQVGVPVDVREAIHAIEAAGKIYWWEDGAISMSANCRETDPGFRFVIESGNIHAVLRKTSSQAKPTLAPPSRG